MAALLNPSFLAAAAALLAAVMLWTSFGRLVLRAVNPPDLAPALPLSLLAGLGAWTLFWLVFVPLGGGDTLVAAPLFLLATLALGASHLRQWARYRGHDEHFHSVWLLHLLMLAPWLPVFAVALPTAIGDFHLLQTLSQLHALGHWPTPAELPAVLPPEIPSGWLVTLLLPHLALGNAVSLAPLFNLVLFAAGATLLAQVSGRPVRWSNLLLAAAGSLPAMLALNPALNPAALTHMQPALAAPVALMAVLLPLASPLPLPTGWAAIPAGLALAWLAAVHPLGLLLALAAAVAWLLRGSVENGPAPRVLLAASWLAVPPLLTTLLLSTLPHPWGPMLPTLGLLLADPALALQTFAPLPQLPPLAWWQPPLLATLALLNLPMALALPPAQRGHTLWPLLALLLLAVPLALMPGARGYVPFVLHAFGLALLIVPLRLWEGYYPSTRLAALAYRRPWTCGLALLFPLAGLVFALTPLLRHAESPWTPHARDIAADMAAKSVLAPGEPLATLGLDPAAVAALSYHLGGHVLEAQPEPPTMADLHPKLRDGGYAHALVGAGSARRLLGFKATVEATLLFATTPGGMVVRGIYPLPLTLAPHDETR